MNTSSQSGGCGSGSCQCATTAAKTATPVASINGIALHAPGELPDLQTLQELAYTELLRQQAVKAGLLPRSRGLSAPVLHDAERAVLETMVDAAVSSPQPTEDECLRYYTANKTQFVVGQAVHVQHILFAVTPGVNVHALTVRAEKALIELLGKDVAPDRFAALAAELSNCPTSTQGGDLGWLQPHDCAPELANELFHQTPSGLGLGVHPRLIHTRFGFHIIQVLGSRKGKQASYEEVCERIAAQLTLQSRAKALHQYMSLLVGQALVEGVPLDRADSPLVQ
ncbi:peptidylprolyl isomerase [Rhodoferax saidenbachensis]|uniref:peptidylprolyl isomerase n=1 Tax=Rhodoferax saidenbachensis TaxID=1484693 RepID=A0ABU1ZTB3_9BURK|nr:peptidylprolyl isomerase [Rhodoferax saidenbachensis]MDR7308792.1 peptidyl-prolyl cis-trans isomerase C [Rhodoferax saidenbachensis]